ncbi:Cof-type HAD-IIB family hydrolase, partial [uncultured Streptococcus sp.]|uniref:Cof-type HAD-IIB family hydrolase n=1 Tax=uncultured Streptococcus sp. TaxID=83427 RepID=UPI0028EE56DA
DIDGTLTNSEKKITPKTKEALLAAQEQGARLILASGRPVSGMQDFAKELAMDKHHGLLVAYNGAVVVDCESGDILFNQAVTVEEEQAVLEHVKQFDVIPMISKGDYMYVNDVYNNMIHWEKKNLDINIIEYESRGGKYLLAEKRDLAAFADFPLNKILLAGSSDYLAAHYKEIAAPFEGKLSSMFTADFYYEFTAQGIDKAKALDTVLAPLGYQPEDMIAFGDGQNDACMLTYSGTAVAMANAVQELKDIADIITLSNDEDGIAETLRDYFNI